jgi:PAS domain S-box-containing protein
MEPSSSSARRLARPSTSCLAGLALVGAIALADALTTSDAALIALLVVAPLVAVVGASASEVAVVAFTALVTGALLSVIDGVEGAAAPLSALATVAGAGALALAFARRGRALERQALVEQQALDEERSRRRRADLLARSGELLSEALDPDAVLDRIVALAVPELADLAIVDILEADGSLRGAVTHATDSELARRLREVREGSPLATDSDHPVAVALRTGEPQLLADLDAATLARHTTGPDHFALARSAGFRSGMALPLIARGRTSGVLSLWRLRAGAPYAFEELAIGLDIARRAALTLDNARLFAELRATDDHLATIIANLGEAVAAVDAEGRFLFVNQPAAELNGASDPSALIGRLITETNDHYIVLDEHGVVVPAEQRMTPAALRGEHPPQTLLRVVDRTSGRDRWLLNRTAPVLDEQGRVRLVVIVSEDVTAVKRQELRERLLSSATKLIGSSLDLDATLDKTAWALVPELADWARVDIPDERGELREVAMASRDPELVELLDQARREHPLERDSDDTLLRVMRTGRSRLWPQVSAADQDHYASSPRHRELLDAIGPHSLAMVPLVAGDEVIGTLQLGTSRISGRRLGPEELAIAEELARRAAIAVENSRLHAERTHIATILQRSLLPPRLPLVPGLTIAARFRAAGALTEVGGDFYDLFEARGQWLVMMGDVTGKGPSAAAITSLARYTMSTVAQYESDVRAMVERLNTTLDTGDEHGQICTAVCVGVREGDGASMRLEIVCAGHPPPLLVRADGEVLHVGTPGTLLGAFPEGTWTSTEVQLASGEALVLYTDGVTDTVGDEGRYGTERLRELLAEVGPADADVIAHRIDDALLGFGDQRDDVALLVLRATPSAGPRASLAGTTTEG